MAHGVFELGNGLTIDASNPETHKTPNYCGECRAFYYFRHVCPDQVDFPINPHPAFKRGLKGYFDEPEKTDEEKVKEYFEQQK